MTASAANEHAGVPAGAVAEHAEVLAGAANERAAVPAGATTEHSVVPADAAAEHAVVALDTLVDGVHFPNDTPARDVGYRALAVNLSDLAAMGATPTEAVAVVSIPEHFDSAWYAAFRSGFDALARTHEVTVTAVDTVRGALSVSVQVHGRCLAGAALTRAGARAGDRIFVSGTLGDAGGGLAIALGQHPARPARSVRVLVARLRRPVPRLALGVALRGIASAAIDVSDGLCQDLGHILAASDAGACIDPGLVPLSSALLDVTEDAAARELALSAGDDYELLFTVPPERLDRLGAAAISCAVTEIGVIEAQPGLRLVNATGTTTQAPPGYRHFHSP